KWNVKHTIKSVSEMIQWRIDNHVDSILEDQSIIHRVDLIRRIIPNAHHGYTKAHQPLYIEKTGQMHVNQVLNEYTTEELMQCHIYWLEFNCERTRERSRQLVVIDTETLFKKGSDTSPVLLQYINSDQLPREYGGNCQSCPTSPDCIPIYDQKQDTDDDTDDDE
ncbi:unnamed protein product, partial [Rotaria sp. Silwood2]